MGKIVRVDSQILNLVQSCPYKAYLSLVRNLKMKTPGDAITRGLVTHEVMKTYYTLMMEGKDYVSSVDAALKVGHEKFEPTVLEMSDIQLVMEVLEQYFVFYKDDRWEPISVEQPFSTIIYEDEELTILLEGIPDLVANTPFGLIGADHKSGSRRHDPLPLSNQFCCYATALDLRNIVVNKINFVKSPKAEDRFQRHIKSYSSKFLEQWLANTVWWVKQFVWYSENEAWPQNFTSCDKYGACTFAPACTVEDGEMREWRLKMDYIVGETWDPLKRDNDG